MRPSGRDRLDGTVRYRNFDVASGGGVLVGENHGSGAVLTKGGFVLATDNREGVDDVGGIFA